MHKFAVGAATMFLTFAVGIAANLLGNGLVSVVHRWIETRGPVLEVPSIQLPALEPPVDLTPGCRILEVALTSDRSLSLFGERMGSLADPGKLVSRLRQLLPESRTENVLTSDDRAAESSETLVVIEAPRSVSHGELSDLSDAIKTAVSGPIWLRPLRKHSANVSWTQAQRPCFVRD